MNAWHALEALFLLGAVMFTVGSAAVLIARHLAREHVEEVERTPDGSHDEYDMTTEERDGEVAWLKELYGPPVIPGRDS